MSRMRVREADRETVQEIADGVLTVGRSPDNHVVLTDRECSRHHCYVERVELGYKLVDLESRNGTKANGKVVNQHLLQPGDVITIGKAELRYEGEASAVRTPKGGGGTPVASIPGRGGGGPVRNDHGPRPGGTLRTSRARAVPRKDSKGPLIVGGIVALAVVAALVVLLGRSKSPEEQKAQELMAKGAEAERRAGALSDPADQARQYGAALEHYRGVPEAASAARAAAQQKIRQIEALRRERLDEAQARAWLEELDGIDRYRDSRTPPDILGTIARYQALLEKLPSGHALRADVETRIRAMDPSRGGGGPSPKGETGAAAGGGWEDVLRRAQRSAAHQDFRDAWTALKQFADGHAGHPEAAQQMERLQGQVRDYAGEVCRQMKRFVADGRAAAARQEGDRALGSVSVPGVPAFEEAKRAIEQELQALP